MIFPNNNGYRPDQQSTFRAILTWLQSALDKSVYTVGAPWAKDYIILESG